jgi:hypothetical protein
MGLYRKFFSREATLPKNFLPKESKAFQGKLRFPENFTEAKLPKFSPEEKLKLDTSSLPWMVLAASPGW